MYRGLLLLAPAALLACSSKPAEPSKEDLIAYAKKATPAEQAELAAVLKNGDAQPVAKDPQAPERTDLIGRGGNPLTLVGETPEVGALAPNFEVRGKDLKPIGLGDYAGKFLVLSVVPSIDTRVCEAQTHKMNEKLTSLPANTEILTVSRDLPFAQTRFAEDSKMDGKLGSDYRGGAFGKAFGLHVKENGLLARSVWIIDNTGKIIYRELVADQATEPAYDELWAALDKATAQ